MNKIICAMGLICMMVFGACEKSVSHLCGGDSPAISLPWLRQEITRLSTSTQCNSISRSTYKEKTVFIFSNCAVNANSIPYLYDCDGNKLDLSPADYQELKFTGDIELIWKNH